jgi:ubiquinone/menaquinone biosynthesis C-methylase UbiE
MNEKIQALKAILGKTDMYLIDLLQKGYFDTPLKILDVGCGSGRNMWMLAELGHQVEGLDRDEEIIAYINSQIRENPERGNLRARVGQMESLPFPDQSFDCVICIAVLHFAQDSAHFEQQFSELVRVAKSGGMVFLRLVTGHTFSAISQTNQRACLPDGTERFVVDSDWLKNELIPSYGLSLAEEFKTVNVADKRAMTTLVLRAK